VYKLTKHRKLNIQSYIISFNKNTIYSAFVYDVGCAGKGNETWG